MSLITPELLARLLDSQASALELFATQWSHSPADIVQEAFVELARQPAVPQNVEAWLFRVVRNRAICEARAATRRRRREAVFAENAAWFSPRRAEIDPAEAAYAVGELSGELREVLVARVWGGLTFDQIGEVAAISVATAFRRYQEALAILRTRLGLTCPNEKTSPKS